MQPIQERVAKISQVIRSIICFTVDVGKMDFPMSTTKFLKLENKSRMLMTQIRIFGKNGNRSHRIRLNLYPSNAQIPRKLQSVDNCSHLGTSNRAAPQICSECLNKSTSIRTNNAPRSCKFDKFQLLI
ncbi:hypothetical protein LINGRAPRIM_LOCUS168 [Linum grandiflorum]